MKKGIVGFKKCIAYVMTIAMIVGTMCVPAEVKAASLGDGNIIISEDTVLTESHTIDPEETLMIAEGVTLTVPSDMVLIVNGTLENQGTLHLGKDNGLTVSGAVTGEGEFLLDEITEAMIDAPYALYYTGEDLTDEVMSQIKVYENSGLTKEIAGIAFDMVPILENWTCTITPEQVLEAGEYTVTYKNGGRQASRTFNVDRAYIDFDGSPTITGVYGQRLSEMTWDVPKTAVSGTWSLLDADVMPTVKGSSTYPLLFTPVDSENYYPAIFYVYPKVSKKSITVTVEDAEKAYYTSNPEFTYVAHSLVGNDATTDWIVDLKTDATKYSDVGTYEIYGTIESDNYDITVVPGTLTICKADTEITLEHEDVITKAYGDVFTLDHVSNNVNGDMIYEIIEGTDVISVSEDGTFTALSTGYAMVSVSLPSTANYNAAASQYVTINIVKGDRPVISPKLEITVPYETRKVSKVTLPEGWTWDANDASEILPVGQKFEAVARYTAADADYYENTKAVVTITRQLCKKGTVLKDSVSKAKYKVTKSALNGGTVMYMSSTKAGAKSITIPATVTVEGVTYKVTAIKASAFAKNTKIKKVVIGKNIEKIGKKAFFGCKNLKSITINTKKLTLKTIGGKAFKGTSAKAVVKVPKSKLKLYKQILKKRGLNKKATVVKK